MVFFFLINFFFSLTVENEASVRTVGWHSLCEMLEQQLFLVTSGPNVLTEFILKPDTVHDQDEVFKMLPRYSTRNLISRGMCFPKRSSGKHKMYNVEKQYSFLGKTK